jgi:hypothetical protein
VALGEAPDGLDLRLLIDRGASAAELLGPVASRLGTHPQDPRRGKSFDDLAAHVDSLFEQRDVQRIETGYSVVDCYVTAHTVGSIVGPTLLARLLDRANPTYPAPLAADTRNFPMPGAATTPGPYQPGPPSESTALPAPPPFPPPPPPMPFGVSRNGSDPATVTSPPPCPPGSGTVPALAMPWMTPYTGIGNSFLALPIDGRAPLVVQRVTEKGAEPAFRYLRPFETESLAAFAGASFEARRAPVGEIYGGRLDDPSAYQSVRRQLLRGGQAYFIQCKVDRADVVARVAEVADALYRLHQSGKVHADVKPANILITHAGVKVIDSLAVTPGAKSPGLTPGWAAPEQVLGDPVSFATDQYAVGLLLCELLQGVLFGEESSFIVPTGGQRTQRFTLLRNPGVYLDPESAPVDGGGIEPWHRPISRCLRFAPADRFASMAELASELRAAANAGKVTGQLEMTPYFGTLVENPESGLLTWQVQDVRG